MTNFMKIGKRKNHICGNLQKSHKNFAKMQEKSSQKACDKLTKKACKNLWRSGEMSAIIGEIFTEVSVTLTEFVGIFTVSENWRNLQILKFPDFGRNNAEILKRK